jgi:DNA repair exonuclease SbcCD ATPase subunit
MPVSSYKNRGDLDRIEVGVKHTEEAIAQLAAEENPHGDALEKLLKEVQPKIDYDKLNGLVKMVTHQKFLIKLLTDKNSFIRKRIISKTIPFLNERLDEYIGKLNLPHTVKFQADMTCEIAEFNRILDHGNLSNGERRRLNLALSLAFRDVLGHLHGRMSSLMCDEIDAGALDSVNVDCMLKLMKEKAKKDNLSVYMISHRPEFEGRCDHTMMIRKENGFSNVVGS